MYPFRFSFVADHFQYLACLGIIILVSAGAALLQQHARGWCKRSVQVGCVAIVAVLALLSWRQSRMYADKETLYRSTIDRNRDCWMAYGNLGDLLAGRGESAAAIDCFQQALRIAPDFAEAHNDFGNLLASLGQIDEAIPHYQQALRIKPGFAAAHNNLGVALAKREQVDEAMGQFQQAVAIKPDYAEAYNDLGIVLAQRRQFVEAIVQYRQALEIQPDYAEARGNLASALARRGEFGAAVAEYQRAADAAQQQQKQALAASFSARVRYYQARGY